MLPCRRQCCQRASGWTVLRAGQAPAAGRRSRRPPAPCSASPAAAASLASGVASGVPRLPTAPCPCTLVRPCWHSFNLPVLVLFLLLAASALLGGCRLPACVHLPDRARRACRPPGFHLLDHAEGDWHARMDASCAAPPPCLHHCATTLGSPAPHLAPRHAMCLRRPDALPLWRGGLPSVPLPSAHD